MIWSTTHPREKLSLVQHMQILSRNICVLLSGPNNMEFWFLVFFIGTWHSAHAALSTIQDLEFECLPHLLYSPDYSDPLSDFRMIGPLTEALGSKSFKSDEGVMQVLHEWLQLQPTEIVSTVIYAFLECWNIIDIILKNDVSVFLYCSRSYKRITE